MNYGVPYQGSKNAIAPKIVGQIPSADVFVDLFAGGCAVTHAALLSGKFKRVIANDIGAAPQLFLDAVSGKFENETRWISREDFSRLKDKDPYVRWCWSFCSKGEDYLYSSSIEAWKKALHFAVFFGDFSELRKFGLNPPSDKEKLCAWIKENEAECREKYATWYMREVLKLGDGEIKRAVEAAQSGVEKTESELLEYLRGAFEKSGLTMAEIDRRCGTNGMAHHWFCKSQWEFPTREFYAKLRTFLDLPRDYDECVNFYGVIAQRLQRLQSLQSLQSLQRLRSLRSLESLQRLRSLESLESLQRLRSLESLQVSRRDYREVEIPPNAVVYCDIPYRTAHSAKKANYGVSFDWEAFYEWAQKCPAPLFISEYSMPPDRFKRVFAMSKRNYGAGSKTVSQTVEGLWIPRSQEAAHIPTGLFDCWDEAG